MVRIAGLMALALVAAAAAVQSQPAGAAPEPPYWFFEATLTDGQTLQGYAPDGLIPFQAVTPAGREVTVDITPPPDYSGIRWAFVVSRDAERPVYVVRATGWTGELQRIGPELKLGQVTLQADRLRQLRMQYVRPRPQSQQR